ncbi:MAG: energy transducer TonB [Polyangiaceae bacterium]
MRDFMPSEIAIAIGVALLVQGGAAVALRMSDLDKQGLASEIDKGTAAPVRVIPVLDEDLPLLKLGGKKQKYKLPDKWNKSAPKPLVEQKAFVSPKADKTEAGIPDKDVKVADAGTEPIPPDADVAKQVDVEVTEATDAGAVANTDTEGHANGSKEGTETDPLKARAVDQWRSRIASWFQRGFSCPQMGLDDAEMKKLRVGVSVQLSGDGTVTGYSMSSSGRPEVDAAARARMDAAKGNAIPPKPENYPDIKLNQISVTLVCK